MKLEIVFGIYHKLRNQPVVKAQEIANEYKVSLRTVFRYLDKMSNVLPIYSIRGAGGGIVY